MSTISIDTSENQAAPSSKQLSIALVSKNALKTVTWTLGTIIFCLALIDFYAQTQAKETKFALRSAQTEKMEVNQDLRISEIEEFIAGSPAVVTSPADQHTDICKEMKQYTWKGIFNSYSITVYLGLGNDPSVDFIHSPGDTAEIPYEQTSTL